MVLVVVRAGADHESALTVRQQHRPERTHVSYESRLREPGDLVSRNLRGGFTDQIGCLRPTAAECQGDVVLVDTRLLGDLGCGLRGNLKRVSGRVVEGVGRRHRVNSIRGNNERSITLRELQHGQ